MSSPFLPANGSPAMSCQRCNAPLPSPGGICGRCGYQNSARPVNIAQQGAAPSGPQSGAFRTQAGSGQYPPAARPGQPLPPGASQPGFPGPGNWQAPPQSMPSPASRPARRRSPIIMSAPVHFPDAPLRRFSKPEAPEWGRLVIILIVLAVLAGGGYWGILILRTSTGPGPTNTVNYKPSGTPLFRDSFTSNTFGWNLQSVEGHYAVTVGKNMLTVECNDQKLLWDLLPGEHNFSNVAVTFDATLSQGDQNNGYGVYLRGASDSTNDLAKYYRFELYGDGSFAVFKGSTDSPGKLTDTRLYGYTGNAAINKQGKVNHVMILANGSKFTFVVNGQAVQTFTDSSYSSGTLAFFVSNLTQAKPGAQAQFSHLVVYPYSG
jgi:Domain of Unknown Function (DUF1080)